MALYNTQNVAPAGFVAGGVIGQYRLVKLDTTEGRVVVTSAIGDVAFGASMDAATAAGQLVTVQQFGKVKLTTSDAVALGAQLMPTNAGSGKVVTASGASARTIGIALQASGADGDVIEVQLIAPIGNGPANS